MFSASLVTLYLSYSFASEMCGYENRIVDNSRLKGFSFDFIKGANVYKCAAECVQRNLCKSFDFDRKRKTCYLNYRNVSEVSESPEYNPDFLHSNVQNWPKSVTGLCKNHTCSKHEKCIVMVNKTAECVPIQLRDLKRDDTMAFTVNSDPRTWTNASSECQKKGGSLMMPKTQDINVFLHEILTELGLSSKKFWLGGTDAAEWRTWRWVDGTEFMYNDWATSEPDADVIQRCMVLKSLEWYNSKCWYENMYICQTSTLH
ncbi:C-type lectin domain family 18 member C-like [Haliotis cracherodii]|uniref:C-type lectin domain family 18 member C-like n=1 Tax=Haliotis cracherodii TaxID=6455 RepID=UPI0039E9C7A8